MCNPLKGTFGPEEEMDGGVDIPWLLGNNECLATWSGAWIEQDQDR